MRSFAEEALACALVLIHKAFRVGPDVSFYSPHQDVGVVAAGRDAPGDASARPDARSGAAPIRPLVIINGNASGLRRHGGVEPVQRLLLALGGPCEIVITESSDAFADAWPADPKRRVILVGGDGTLHTAANLPCPEPEIALIPAGRANNVARSLGIPLELEEAAHLAVHGHPHPIDLIEAKSATMSYRVVEGLSVGFLASTRARFDGRNSAATLPALWAGVKAFGGFHPLGVHVTRHGSGEDDLHIAQLFVANLPLYEFGLRVAPHVDPRDGMLDFVAIDAAGRRSILPMIARLLRGSHIGHDNVHIWREPHARIVAHGQSPIVGDSTNLGSGVVELSPVLGALRIVTPEP